MNTNRKICLYCQTPNDNSLAHCKNCGMPLADKSINQVKTSIFVKVFWAIVIFCALMIYILPR